MKRLLSIGICTLLVLVFSCTRGTNNVQKNWKENWAGESIDRSLKIVGAPVLIEGFESLPKNTRGQMNVRANNLPSKSEAPVVKLISEAKDGRNAGWIVNPGTEYGLFNSSREGWKRMIFNIEQGILENCTGIRFWIRSQEAYEEMPIEFSESLPPQQAQPERARSASYRTFFDVPGDNQWHEIDISFFGDDISPTLPANAERINRISFFLPYNRPMVFAIDRLEAFHAETGDVPMPQVMSILNVSKDSQINTQELGNYKELALTYQAKNSELETAKIALNAASQAQEIMKKYVNNFKTQYNSQQNTYSYQRAVYALNYTIWQNEIEIDRLNAWQKHTDGTIAYQTPLAEDHYTAYPVELCDIAYWSQGLRITGMIAKPKGEGVFPLVIVNHGRGSYSKNHIIQIARIASAGFVAFACDYRGQGNAEGISNGGGSLSALDVVNGVKAVRTMPFVKKSGLGMWGHSMGGSVSWNVLKTELEQEIQCYVQVSSGLGMTDEQLAAMKKIPIRVTAGGAESSLESRLRNNLPGIVEKLEANGIPVEHHIYPGYSHHAMKYHDSLYDAIAFFRKYVK